MKTDSFPEDYDYSEVRDHLSVILHANGISNIKVKKELRDRLIETTHLFRLMYIDMQRHADYNYSDLRQHLIKLHSYCDKFERELMTIEHSGINLLTHQLISLNKPSHINSEDEFKTFIGMIFRFKRSIEFYINLIKKLPPGGSIQKGFLRDTRYLFIKTAASNCQEIASITVTTENLGIFYEIIEALLPIVTNKERSDIFRIIKNALSSSPFES